MKTILAVLKNLDLHGAYYLSGEDKWLVGIPSMILVLTVVPFSTPVMDTLSLCSFTCLMIAFFLL